MYPPVRRKKKVSWVQKAIPVLLVILILLLGLCMVLLYITNAGGNGEDPTDPDQTTQTDPTTGETTEPTVPETTLPVFETEMERAIYTIQTFAQANNIALDAYPQMLYRLLEWRPEAEEYVLNYPIEYGKTYPADMSEYVGTGKVPLLMQWDKRWGNKVYSSNSAGLTACGPTCLSMVALYLTGNTDMSPAYMMDFAIENGYYVSGAGSTWTLFSQGTKKLGLKATELPLVKSLVVEHLKAGEPVVCVVGPGVFTDGGHFIVLTGYENGLFQINDPNSITNSEKLWRFEEFQDQIENLWAISKA